MIPARVFEQTVYEFLEPIRSYLEDPSVSEIMINGPDQVYIERSGRVYPTNARFASRETLIAALRNLAQFVGRHADEERPVLEARLPDGSRVEAVLPPAAPDGPMVSIRRFLRETLTMDQMVRVGSLTPDAAEFLSLLIAVKQNVIIAGGAGSGKTSMLNALSFYIPENERVIVIESSRELQLQRAHVVQLEGRQADARGRGTVSIRELFNAALRLRPDRILVGEIRGGEALDLIQAMTSGHAGSLSTAHATYPTDTLNRLETMALMSDVNVPLQALRTQLGSAIDFIVQTSRLRDGTRCVTHITEVQGYDPQRGFMLVDIFRREFEGEDPNGRVISRLIPTGELPKIRELALGMGLDLPRAVYEASSRSDKSRLEQ